MWFSILLLPAVLALRTLEPPPPAVTTPRQVSQGWLDVRLNQFAAFDQNTFPMRFFYNDEFGRDNIVIFVGGEWEISEGWVRAGLAHEFAKLVNGTLFYTEHRYYGETRPSGDTNVSDLRYLTVDQALGDLVQFIQHVKSDQFLNGDLRDAKVALVGCSYAGSMATWMRLAYPHMVQAVLSDSGPLHAQEDFPEYLEVITEALRTQGGEECLTGIEQAILQVTELLETQEGTAQVSEMFNTCSTIQSGTPLDVATFFWFGITETFAYLVQYAIPGDIPAACAVITNSSLGIPAERLASWITAQPWTQPCIETRYTEVVAAHTNVSYDAPEATMRLWTYQTCVEFGWYQTTTSSRQPFLSTVPLEYFHQMCRDFFGPLFDESFLRSGIERTNLLFAGVTHLPDHVVSVAGGADPWSPMGPNTTHATTLAPVYMVPDVSHCRAIRPTATSESEELNRAQHAALAHMYEYIKGEQLSVSSASRHTAIVVLIALLAFLV